MPVCLYCIVKKGYLGNKRSPFRIYAHSRFALSVAKGRYNTAINHPKTRKLSISNPLYLTAYVSETLPHSTTFVKALNKSAVIIGEVM